MNRAFHRGSRELIGWSIEALARSIWNASARGVERLGNKGSKIDHLVLLKVILIVHRGRKTLRRENRFLTIRQIAFQLPWT